MYAMQGQGFSLRPFRHVDVPQFVAAVRESMDTLGVWMPWAHPGYCAHDAQGWFELCAENLSTGLSCDIGVYSPDGRELYGSVAINQISPDCAMGNLGYWIRRSRQGKGLATRAAIMMACHGFHRMHLSRIEIIAAEHNHASRRVAEKTGALLECIARNRLILHGVPCRAAIYSLVPESFAEPNTADRALRAAR